MSRLGAAKVVTEDYGIQGHGWTHPPPVGGVLKSHEQDLISVCRSVLLDAAAKCYTNQVSVDRDLTTIESRVKDEGLSFLTITLPAFGKAFEKCLAEGMVSSSAFPGWKKRMCLPAFLQGFTSLVFNAETGGLLDESDIAALEGIRQIAYTFKKLSCECTRQRVERALLKYEEVESHLSRTMFDGGDTLFVEVSRLLWGNVFAGGYPFMDTIPKHGPGQTAEHISGNRKYVQRRWHERLEPFFPMDGYVFTNVEHMLDPNEGASGVQLVGEDAEEPVRVTTVPKTMKGPRIIAMEPVCMMYAQQALSRWIIGRIESHWLTGGHINFRDQEVNRGLAVSASKSGRLATLDLSEASDRVPLSLVTKMLEVHGDLLDAILACRSKAARLPSGKVISLSKFASMGSALCFPIEAMFFFSGIIAAMLRKQGLSVTLRNIYKVSREVFVYGDDIIIPVAAVESVVETLTILNCKVNLDKSYWTGRFRESCGADAYAGELVTPTYLHHRRPHNREQSEELLSLIATSNLFYKQGYWRTSSLLMHWVESIIGKLPIIRENAPCLGWLSFQGVVSYGRWSRRLHRFEVYSYVATPTYRKDPLEGWSALLKCLLKAELGPKEFWGSEPIDKKHLERSSRSGTSSMKRRWAPPY